MTRRIPWRVDERKSHGLRAPREKITHENVNPEVEPKDKGIWVEASHDPSERWQTSGKRLKADSFVRHMHNAFLAVNTDQKLKELVGLRDPATCHVH